MVMFFSWWVIVVVSMMYDVHMQRVHWEHERGTHADNGYCRESKRNTDDNQSWVMMWLVVDSTQRTPKWRWRWWLVVQH